MLCSLFFGHENENTNKTSTCNEVAFDIVALMVAIKYSSSFLMLLNPTFKLFSSLWIK